MTNPDPMALEEARDNIRGELRKALREFRDRDALHVHPDLYRQRVEHFLSRILDCIPSSAFSASEAPAQPVQRDLREQVARIAGVGLLIANLLSWHEVNTGEDLEADDDALRNAWVAELNAAQDAAPLRSPPAPVASVEARQDRLYDSAYAAGAKAGYNLGVTEDAEALSKLVSQRWRGHAEAMRAADACNPAPAERPTLQAEGVEMVENAYLAWRETDDRFHDRGDQFSFEAGYACARQSAAPDPDLMREVREKLEWMVEESDTGRSDGLPEPCPAHEADAMWAVANALLSRLQSTGQQAVPSPQAVSFAVSTLREASAYDTEDPAPRLIDQALTALSPGRREDRAPAASSSEEG